MAFALTPDQKARFQQDGYLRLDPFIPSDDLEPLRRRLDALLSGAEAFPPESYQTLDPQKYRTANGLPIPEGIQRPMLHDEAFARIAQHPNLVAVMRGLIGEDAQLFTDQVIVKNPEAGVTTHFHQDGYYWRNSGARTINLWIALDDADEDNGALIFMPGSQRDGLVDHEAYYDEPTLHSGVTGKAFQRLRIPLETVDFTKERAEPVKAGGCVLFGKHCWHRSNPNRAGRQRRAYAIAYHGAQAE
ncbi:MAG: phytanoyl-CoA dioxygenase family protein [Candidatus Poribacteria bacterium]|nr:phytanoyl-CoA dioxygenase family protein [Candidatus Poribacteria bacterium]